jgi:hypothetical protein
MPGGAVKVVTSVDPRVMANLRKVMQNIDSVYLKAFGTSEAEFGAYTSYSAYIEHGGIHHARPHIIPAVENNLKWILDEMSKGLFAEAGLGAVNKGVVRVSISKARKRVEKLWEDTLNGKPLADARANAPVYFGIHKSTIRGYGKLRKDSDILNQQEATAKQVIQRKREARQTRRG